MFADSFDQLIQKAITEMINEAMMTEVEKYSDVEYVASETIGEVLDKLIVLHIRLWHLIDAANAAQDDVETYAEIYRKIDHCYRVKRPRLVNALNVMLKMAVQRGRLELVSDYPVKQY